MSERTERENERSDGQPDRPGASTPEQPGKQDGTSTDAPGGAHRVNQPASEGSHTPPRQNSPRLLFGDDVGLALFLASLCLTWLTWDVGIFITDTYAVANTLANVAEGHLTIERLEYSLTLGSSQPGLHVVDGQLYGRNYGQVFLSLPAYYGFELAETVTETWLLVPGVWSLMVLALSWQVGVLAGHRQTGLVGGSVLATVLFLSNLLVASPLGDDAGALLALQVTASVAVGATSVLLYRTLRRHHEWPVAVTGGAGVVVATPLWFWATIPKRHVFTAAGVAALLFVFASSRRDSSTRGLKLRAAGYVVAGLVAWIHVFEGVALLVAYGAADLASAPATGRREAVVLVVALSVAFAPFAATNVLVSGNPVESPRLTPGLHGEESGGVELGPGGTVTQAGDRSSDGGSREEAGSSNEGGGNGSESSAGESSSGETGGESSRTERISEVISRTVREGEGYLTRTIGALKTAPIRLYHTYVRSGYIEFRGTTQASENEAIDLSLLESVPVAGTLLVGAGIAVVRIRRRASERSERSVGTGSVTATGRQLRERIRSVHPATQTAALALLIVAGFGTMYLSYLPNRSQITVRYLMPVVPALVYLVVRTPPVRAVVRGRPRTLATSYLVAVGLGGVLVLVGYPHLGLAVGEAMQLHALVNLGLGAVGCVALTLHSRESGVGDRGAAVGLALPAAATTVLVVLLGLVYFDYGTDAIPLVRHLTESLVLVG